MQTMGSFCLVVLEAQGHEWVDPLYLGFWWCWVLGIGRYWEVVGDRW